ncbi:GIY-YIG nuclease family protein [Candidatus Omnitrophota bacterium]
MPWYVYIIQCKDKSLYTGITNNLKRRIKEHNSGNGCKYTKYRRPVSLIHSEEFPTKSQSLKREAYIKRLTRQGKAALVLAQGRFRNAKGLS